MKKNIWMTFLAATLILTACGTPATPTPPPVQTEEPATTQGKWKVSQNQPAENQASLIAAFAARGDPMADLARLTTLNRRIDAISDETAYGNNDAAYSNYLAERDLIQARIDRATAAPVMFSTNILYWLKAGFFHGMVFLFSAFFSIPMKAKSSRRAGSKKSASSAPRGNPDWPAANF